MCQEEKIISIRHNKVRNSYFLKKIVIEIVLFKKNTEAATGDAQAVTGGVL